jgi:hypothetical protein
MPGTVTQGFVKTYDPKKVLVSFMGQPITGFADGTFINIANRGGDRWAEYVGADGEVSRAKNVDTTKRITITLSQTSLSNSFLSDMLALDMASSTAVGPLKITDVNGGAEIFVAQAWIAVPPAPDYAKGIMPRVWVFDTGQAVVESFHADYVNLSQ